LGHYKHFTMKHGCSRPQSAPDVSHHKAKKKLSKQRNLGTLDLFIKLPTSSTPTASETNSQNNNNSWDKSLLSNERHDSFIKNNDHMTLDISRSHKTPILNHSGQIHSPTFSPNIINNNINHASNSNAFQNMWINPDLTHMTATRFDYIYFFSLHFLLTLHFIYSFTLMDDKPLKFRAELNKIVELNSNIYTDTKKSDVNKNNVTGPTLTYRTASVKKYRPKVLYDNSIVDSIKEKQIFSQKYRTAVDNMHKGVSPNVSLYNQQGSKKQLATHSLRPHTAHGQTDGDDNQSIDTEITITNNEIEARVLQSFANDFTNTHNLSPKNTLNLHLSSTKDANENLTPRDRLIREEISRNQLPLYMNPIMLLVTEQCVDETVFDIHSALIGDEKMLSIVNMLPTLPKLSTLNIAGII
jgi:hypothetical protein